MEMWVMNNIFSSDLSWIDLKVNRFHWDAAITVSLSLLESAGSVELISLGEMITDARCIYGSRLGKTDGWHWCTVLLTGVLDCRTQTDWLVYRTHCVLLVQCALRWPVFTWNRCHPRCLLSSRSLALSLSLSLFESCLPLPVKSTMRRRRRKEMQVKKRWNLNLQTYLSSSASSFCTPLYDRCIHHLQLTTITGRQTLNE